MAATPTEKTSLFINADEPFPLSKFSKTRASSPYKFKFSWRKLASFMGPGWVMSLAYLDPGNLEADLQQGAYTNMTLLWVLWWATCAGFLLQELSSRLAMVTGLDLAECSKRFYGRNTSLALYALMELAIIGSDIQEVVGSAIAFQLLFGWPLWVGCLVTGLDSFTFLAIYQCGAGYFEALIAALVALIAGCFFTNFFATASAATVGSVASGLAVPRLVPSGLVVAMGTLGAVIMPHNLYLHSGLVKTRAASDASFDRTNADAVAEANTYSAIESGIALLTSFFVNLAVVGTFAHFFFSPECSQGLSTPMACVPLDHNSHAGSTALDSFSNLGNALACSNDAIPQGVEARCAEIGLDGAGAALESTIGALGKTTWAVGLLAAGQASTMSTTFAGQVVMDGFLSLRLSPWQRASVTRLAALGPSLSIAIFTSDHATTRNAINEWLNILQSIQLPFAIIPVLTFTASAAIMNVRNTDHGSSSSSSSSGSGTGHANGNRFRNRGVMLFLALSLTALVLGANVFLVHDFLATHPAGGWAATLAAAGLGLAYFAFVLHLARTGVQYAQGKLLPPPPPASPPLPSSLAPSSLSSSLSLLSSSPWLCGSAQGRPLPQQEPAGQSSAYPPARLVVALPATPGISSASSHPQRELEDGHPPVHGDSISEITAIHGRGYGAVKSQP